MFLLIGQLIGTVIGAILSVLPSSSGAAGAYGGLPHPVIQALVGAGAVFGLFIDLPVLFVCLGIVLAWRLFWLAVRVWQIVLSVIPCAG